MSLYSSKTPRDLNHDPKAWKCTSCGDRFVREQGVNAPTSHVTKRGPLRPEFDHVQHNPPNPILTEFRISRGNYRAHEKLLAIRHYLIYIDGDVYGWKPEQRTHARRVLTRLAALKGES